MRERLFANPQALGDTAAHVAALGLDAGRMTTCMSAGTYDAEIRKDMAQAQAAGVSGTPSFLIAISDPATHGLKAIRRLEGAQPFAAFKAQLDAVLAEQGR
jgi:predicted DsbA family dithiol-disulfide isomerase